MPFITQERRTAIARGGQPEVVGDLCYIAYKQMVEEWGANPRWTTAHKIFLSFYDYLNLYKSDYGKFEYGDYSAAINLAWQVFFQNYVMPYEREKERENGTI